MKFSELYWDQGAATISRPVRFSHGLNIVVDPPAQFSFLRSWLGACLFGKPSDASNLPGRAAVPGWVDVLRDGHSVRMLHPLSSGMGTPPASIATAEAAFRPAHWNELVDQTMFDTFFCVQPAERGVLARMATWMWSGTREQAARPTNRRESEALFHTALAPLRVRREELRARIAELTKALDGMQRRSGASASGPLEGTVLQDSLEELTERIEQCHIRIKNQQARRDFLDAKLMCLGQTPQAELPPQTAKESADSLVALYARLAESDAQFEIWHQAQMEIQSRRVAIRDTWSREHELGPEAAAASRSRLREIVGSLREQWSHMEPEIQGSEVARGKQMRLSLDELALALDQHERKLRHLTSTAELRQLRKCYHDIDACCQQLIRRRTALVESLHTLDPHGAERILGGPVSHPHVVAASAASIASGSSAASANTSTAPASMAEYDSWQMESMRQQRATIHDGLIREEANLRDLVCRRDACVEQLQRRQGSPPPALAERLRAEIDAKSAELETIRQQIDTTAVPLEKTVCECLETASHYLQEWTQGQWTSVELAEYGPSIVLTSALGHTQDAERAEQSTQCQVALCLAVAMAQTMSRTGWTVPLVWLNPLAGMTNSMASFVVRLAGDCLAHDHQLLVVVRSESDFACLAELHPTRIELPSVSWSTIQSAGPLALVDANTIRGHFTPRPASLPTVAHAAHGTHEPEEREPVFRFPIERAWMRSTASRSVTSHHEESHTLGVSTTSPLRDVGVCSYAECLSLERIGIRTVRQFLDAEPETLPRRLPELQGNGTCLRRCQACCWLLVCIPEMDVEDAFLMFDCGIESPQDLEEVRGELLLRRIQDYLSSHGRADSFAKFTVDRINGWMRSLARTRPMWKQIELRRRNEASADRYSWSHRKLHATVMSPTISLAENRPAQTVTTRPASETAPDWNDRPRFYLHLNDSVDAAPSIGARIVQQLAKMGIRTVRDFLNRKPEEIAQGFEKSRTSADTVQQWQYQARLACSVPNVRRHDAQILVACGISDASQLAGLQPADLLRRVDEFAATKAGQRLLRNTSKPDLAEISGWIRGAAQWRSVQAA